MRTKAICFALVLSIAPQLAMASAAPGSAGPRSVDAVGSVPQKRYNLVPGPGTDQIVAAELSQRKFPPESRSAREADGARFGDGEVQYIEGPSWDYRMSRRGPMFEVGALGGGMESAPYLAHVAMDWRF